MGKFKPATISKGSFAFCRTTIACLLWLSILFQKTSLIWVTFLIMLFSAIFKVEKAPLIVLWKYTFERFFPSKPEVVDERGIFVSHVVAVIFSLLVLLLIQVHPLTGWIFCVIFAILQTSAACGFCSALKLYECIMGGRCCRFGKKVKNNVRHS